MSIIFETLDDGGSLSKVIPGFKSRPQQLEFAKKTAKALVYGGALLAECPPGVGKSFGYCVPIIGMIRKTPMVERTKLVKDGQGGFREKRFQDPWRAVIVTANIALQEQLVEKDLPMLQRVMPVNFQFKLAKGRSNYICYDLVHSDRASQVEMYDLSAVDEFNKLLTWARETETGDKSELEIIPNPHVWSELSRSSEECKGRRCKNYDKCFVNKAREGMKEANIIVCNYHLFFTHLAFGTTVIPDYDAVVMDEAHNAVDIARDIFGWKLGYYAIRKAAAPLRLIGLSDTRASLMRATRDYFDSLKAFRSSADYKARLKTPNAVDPSFLLAQLNNAIQSFANVVDSGKSDERRYEAKLWMERCEKIKEKVLEGTKLDNKHCVYFIELDNKGHASLCKTVDVAKPLYERLFGDIRTVVLTSATLAVRGTMKHLVGDLGLWRDDVEMLIVDSPFDLAKQSLIIVPRETPGPDNAEGIANMVEQCVEAAQGRTLCLFTSYKNLAVTRDRLRERTSWNILAQGDRPRTKLVAEFRADVRSVLLGVESFWAGIDVPGETLSCLIIDRLPFPTPDDPILDATKDRGDNWFIGYSIPRAVTTFRQGAGRLIRSISDRGVIVVLDDRIVKKSYGKNFTSSFPKRMRISKNLAELERFLAERV
jgi:ATP-dependent DNA helicase DinG